MVNLRFIQEIIFLQLPVIENILIRNKLHLQCRILFLTFPCQSLLSQIFSDRPVLGHAPPHAKGQ